MQESKMFEHCRTVYEGMLAVSAEGNGTHVYRGFLSTLIHRELGLPLSYYTEIKGVLEQLGCIEQVKRGGGTTPSEWKLYGPPDPYLFEQIRGPTQRRRAGSISMMEQSILSLNTRLIEVERQVALLIEEVRSSGNRHMGRGV
jgi:hypothetical protein